ncbi:unnamed protein product [Taenia asiatica]|uniref:Uncharacterized protein n=1 Tax=Taenia asiatica TaxID=60517 RepID=A0A0R3W6Z9_TAEAS|nr:unnamed protein product [Taenia asiatica]
MPYRLSTQRCKLPTRYICGGGGRSGRIHRRRGTIRYFLLRNMLQGDGTTLITGTTAYAVTILRKERRIMRTVRRRKRGDDNGLRRTPRYPTGCKASRQHPFYTPKFYVIADECRIA